MIKSTSGEQKGSVLFDFLNETIKTLLMSGQDEQNLIDDFNKYLQYSDIKYFTIKSILNLVKIRSKELTKTNVILDDQKINQNEEQTNNNQDDRQYLDNLTRLLLSIKLPIGNSEKGQKELENLRPLVLDDQFNFNYESASKLYSDTWQMFLSFKVILIKFNFIFNLIYYQ